MRVTLAAAVFLFSAALLGGSSLAQSNEQTGDAEEKVTVTTRASDGETRAYRVVVTVRGSMPAPGTGDKLDLDVVYDLTVRHRFGRADRDGLTPLDITASDAKASVGGQELAVAAGTFPKITVLLDRNWRITDVFGLADYPRTVPGINYGNLIVLFFLPGSGVPRVIGEKWTADVVFPAYEETYRFTNTIRSVDRSGSPATARVEQTIEWLNPRPVGSVSAVARAQADSIFELDGGRLRRSSVRCEVIFGSARESDTGKEVGSHRAEIRIEVSPHSPAARP